MVVPIGPCSPCCSVWWRNTVRRLRCKAPGPTSAAFRDPPKELHERITESIRLFPCDLLLVHRDAEGESLEKRRAEIQHAVAEMYVGLLSAGTLLESTDDDWSAGVAHRARPDRLRGGKLVPRGVYRFARHEEADQWMMRQIAASHAPPSSKTS